MTPFGSGHDVGGIQGRELLCRFEECLSCLESYCQQIQGTLDPVVMEVSRVQVRSCDLFIAVLLEVKHF